MFASPARALRIFLTLVLAGLALSLTGPVRADPVDINAASRSVVRIVLVAEEDGRVYYVGHGSGFAVSDNLVVTNAHLVEMLREDKSIMIGIIPSQGAKSYGGRLVAVSPRNDLALIRLEEGRLPAATLFAGPASDGEEVVAVGYPGAVDRAQGLGVGELIEPMAPVKTPGVVSGGRSTREFDTILHTAALATGNSGGPLVDTCGRVLGVNSFGSLSDGNDAEFGFAVSNRELTDFLRAAKVSFRTTDVPCQSLSTVLSDEAARNRLAQADLRERAAARRASDEAREQAALREAERQIASQRENHIAIAAVLLGLAILAGGAALVLFDRNQRPRGKQAAIGSALLLFAATVAFLLRPSYSDAKDIAAAALEREESKRAALETVPEGTLQCALEADRSRLTVSPPAPVTLDWTATGCFDGAVQYGRAGAGWRRVVIDEDDQAVIVNRFDPDSAEWRSDRYLPGFAELETLRAIRDRYSADQCSTDPDVLAEVDDMQAAMLQALPRQPNEVMVYSCTPTTPATRTTGAEDAAG